MSHFINISKDNSHKKSDIFPCRVCKVETSQKIFSKIDTEDSALNGEVQFWHSYLTLQCNGCATVNFCIVYQCSEEIDHDDVGNAFLAKTKTGYPPPKVGDIDPNTLFINPAHIEKLGSFKGTNFDPARLILIAKELNKAYIERCYFSCGILIRSILDHIPPVFGKTSFGEVASNYAGSRSFKDAMTHLEKTSRKIADGLLHGQIRQTESLPTHNQIDFRQAVDFLISEAIRIWPPKP